MVRAFVSYVHRIDSNSILLLLKSSDVAIGVEEMHQEVQIDAVPIRSTSIRSRYLGSQRYNPASCILSLCHELSTVAR